MQDYFEFANAFMGKSKEEDECESDYKICAPSLAMAYVPLQKYREMYSEAVGFEKGTIFKELDKPFEGVAQMNMMKSREQLLKEIGMHSFAAFEIALFLDNHPDETAALKDRQKHLSEAKRAVEEYESRYGALKMNDIPAQNKWTWINDPWPWNNERDED